MRHTNTLLSALSLCLLTLTAAGQKHAKAPVDEWEYMKIEAARDPFGGSDHFSINFANYTIEEWCYPLPGAKVISDFGGARNHKGIDLKTVPGDTLRAAFPGEVILSGMHFGYGNCVILRHANGLETLYSHNSTNLVKVGQWIQAGEPVALEGSTGRASTHHLHFETKVRGTAFNSNIIFDHANHTLRREVFIVKKTKNGNIKVEVAPPYK